MSSATAAKPRSAVERMLSSVASKRLNDTTERNMAPKDGTEAERNARYERIEKASAKTIKNMLAGTVLGDKLSPRATHACRKRKTPLRKRTDRRG
jgi:hypothetical protein